MGVFQSLANAGKSVGNFGIGVGKSIMDIPREFGELGVSIGDKLYEGVTGKEPSAESPFKEGVKKTKFTRPTNTAQKTGFAAGQVGQFFVPGVGQGKIATTLGKAGKAFGAGENVAARIPGFSKMASEALTQGGIGAVQSGDLGTGAKTAAASVVVSPAFKGIEKAGKYMSEKLTPRVIESLIKPASKDLVFGKQPGNAILEEGLKARTIGGLLKKISNTRKTLGKEIGAQLEGVNKKVDITDAVNVLDDKIASAYESGEKALANRLKDVKEGLTKKFSRESGEVIGDRDLNVLVSEARKIKTKLGRDVKWTNQAFDNDVNAARIAVYNAINKQIEKAVPSIKALNRRYANLLTAEKAAAQRELSNRSKSLPNVLRGAAGIAGTAYGLSQGQSLPESLLLGAAATAGKTALESTAAKTYLEAPIVNAAGKVLQGMGKSAPAVTGITGKVLGNEEKNKSQEQTFEPVESEQDFTLEEEYPQFTEQIQKAREQGVPDDYIRSFIEQNLPSP